MKTNTIIISIALVVIAGWGVTALLPEKNAAAQVTAPLTAQESFYDFGTITMKDGLVDTEYTLTNEGDEPLTIGKVYTSCMCTTASITESNGTEKGKFGMPGHRGILTTANTTVAPGESVTVTAVFDPNAHGPAGTGLAQRSIFLETDSTKTPEVELRFKAMVTN